MARHRNVSGVLRVLTLNIWNIMGGWSDRRAEIVAWLDRLAPDIVCLQEVVDSDDGQNQARWLAAETAIPYNVAWGGTTFMAGIRAGNAVMSRWAIDEEAVIDLPFEPHPEEIQRVVVHARTHGLDVFCTHLNWRYEHGAMRERQVLALLHEVESRASADSPLPPIIGGDFNAEPDSTEIRHLSGLTSLEGRSTYFQDAWRVAGARGPGWTWDNRNPFAAAEFEPDRRIDYVFAGWRCSGGAGRIESARVVCDRALTGTFATDHLGLLAEIAT